VSINPTITRFPPSATGDPGIDYLVHFDRQDLPVNTMVQALVTAIIERVADRYVEEHYTELAMRLDQQAIANLAVAEAGKKIAEEIRVRPTILREGPAVVNHYTKRSLF